jgi:hypothetical protein
MKKIVTEGKSGDWGRRNGDRCKKSPHTYMCVCVCACVRLPVCVCMCNRAYCVGVISVQFN